MSVAEYEPNRQRQLNSLLGVVAWILFIGALAGVLLDRNSDHITQYFMAVQDAPVLFVMGLFCLSAGWFARNQSGNLPEIGLGRLDASRIAWIIAIIVG